MPASHPLSGYQANLRVCMQTQKLQIVLTQTCQAAIKIFRRGDLTVCRHRRPSCWWGGDWLEIPPESRWQIGQKVGSFPSSVCSWRPGCQMFFPNISQGSKYCAEYLGVQDTSACSHAQTGEECKLYISLLPWFPLHYHSPQCYLLRCCPCKRSAWKSRK